MTPGYESGPQRSRALVVWCDQWPVVAVGAAPDELVAVVDAGRVVAATPAALGSGVRSGQRRREAQGRCPALSLRTLDTRMLAAGFEPVVAAVTNFSPRVEMERPGDCALSTRGPARYFGGEVALAEQVRDAVDTVVGALGWPGWVRVAVADGAGATRLVARHVVDPGDRLVVPAGGTPASLAALPVDVLFDDPALAGLLVRLGIDTVAAFANLAASDVLARFGSVGLAAHTLVTVTGDRPALGDVPAPELVVVATLDPPAERADAIAFASRPAADEFHRRLAVRGATSATVTVEMETEHGEVCSRLWRYDGSAPGLVERVRWQLDGWLSGPVATQPTAGVSRVRFIPGEVVAATGRQLGLWGGERAADQRAQRAVSRIDALLGPGSVTVPRPRGGRGPAEWVVRVPAVQADASPGAVPTPEAPWPGAVPHPPPATVHDPLVPVEVVDASGVTVGVDGRQRLSAPPARVGGEGVVAWAGPWLADERWWDPAAHRRRARLQVRCANGTALLVVREGGRWWQEATYD